ncbi:MAG: hypothetical protein BWZ08_02118 [candidate division BRC1 bacterium ADurb.BinA292]|nr:MAG: hypothetical protein BWZ08_02118 [candidate division BRC1 bacterium ADurb.BinA292]
MPRRAPAVVEHQPALLRPGRPRRIIHIDDHEGVGHFFLVEQHFAQAFGENPHQRIPRNADGRNDHEQDATRGRADPPARPWRMPGEQEHGRNGREDAAQQNRRLAHADGGEQDEADRERPRDRADRIGGVGVADLPPGALRADHDQPRRERERHPHQRGRDQQQRGALNENQRQRLVPVVPWQFARQQPGKPRQLPVEQQRQDAPQADQPLQHREQRQGTPQARRDPSQQPAPAGQADQKHHQNRGEGIGGIMHMEHQHPVPEDLHAHRAESGEADRPEHELTPAGAQIPRRDVRPGFVETGLARLGLRRRPRWAPVEQDRAGADQQVDRRRHEDRPLHAQHLDQDEAGQERAEDRAKRVRGIEEAQFARHRQPAPREEAIDHRQRAPHEKRRQQHQRQNDGEARDREQQKIFADLAIDPHEQGFDLIDQPGKSQRRHADRDLQCAVESQGSGYPVGEPTEGPASQRQSEHEGAQYGRNGIDTDAKDQRQHPRPDDLVDQAARAGTQ